MENYKKKNLKRHTLTVCATNSPRVRSLMVFLGNRVCSCRRLWVVFVVITQITRVPECQPSGTAERQ